MEITDKDLKHLAELSNFTLSDEEMSPLKENLQSIINYISELNELNTDNIEPTYQVFEMENVWRDDEIKPMEADRDALLNLTVEEKENQIKVPKVL